MLRTGLCQMVCWLRGKDLSASRSKGVLPMERRNDPRFPIHWRMVFSGALVAGEGTVTNLSMRGCAVESHMPVPSGTELELCALIPDDDCPWTPEKAVVRWSFLRKFGLEFTRIRPEEQERLRGFVSTLETGPSH